MTLIIQHTLRIMLLMSVVLATTGTSASIAQQHLPSESRALLQHALSVLGLSEHDAIMPVDVYTRDVHRLAIHDSIFSDPIRRLDAVHDYADFSSREDPAGALHLGLSQLDLMPPRRVDVINPRPPYRELPELQQPLPQTMREIVNRVLQVLDMIRKGSDDWRRRWWDYDVLGTQMDSLWMNQEDDPNESVYEGYAKQREQRALAERAFAQADTALHTPMTDLYSFGLELYGRLLGTRLELRELQASTIDSCTTITFMSDYGRVAIGGAGNDVYVGTYALIIDLGGDDIYRAAPSSKLSYRDDPIQCIVDRSGNDTYLGGDYCFGGSIAGISIVIDDQGNDTYRAGDWSLGASLFGVGILHDEAGQDSYMSGQNTQGAAVFGLALLNDVGGNDVYTCFAQGQGFGGTRGLGLLFDHAGNDYYVATSPYLDVLRYDAHFVTFTQGAALGYRPLASGGIGILADDAGNDHYATDIYGQGTAYWYAVGGLVDRSGEDHYNAYQYAQGSGVHLAAGILHDLSGSDVYSSHGVSQGCGHDLAIGILADDAGNDSYTTESLSLGGGNANAVSLFIDRSGDDSYAFMNDANTLGYSDFRRYSGMIGVFVDGGGNDRYTEASRNSTQSVKSTYGVHVDTNMTASVAPPGGIPESANVLPMVLSNTFDSLFIQASAAPLRFQPLVGPARDRLATFDPEVVLPLLFAHASSGMPRERLTIEDVVPKLRTRESSTVDAFLDASLRSSDASVVLLAATIVGKTRAPLVEPLTELLAHPSWRLRRAAALTLGLIGQDDGIPALESVASDTNLYVRQHVGYALGLLGASSSSEPVRRLLHDTSRMVVYNTVEGMVRGPERDEDEIRTVVSILTPAHRRILRSQSSTPAAWLAVLRDTEPGE